MDIVCSVSSNSYADISFKESCQPCISYVSDKSSKWAYCFSLSIENNFIFHIRCKKFNKNGFASNQDKLRELFQGNEDFNLKIFGIQKSWSEDSFYGYILGQNQSVYSSMFKNIAFRQDCIEEYNRTNGAESKRSQDKLKLINQSLSTFVDAEIDLNKITRTV